MARFGVHPQAQGSLESAGTRRARAASVVVFECARGDDALDEDDPPAYRPGSAATEGLETRQTGRPGTADLDDVRTVCQLGHRVRLVDELLPDRRGEPLEVGREGTAHAVITP